MYDPAQYAHDILDHELKWVGVDLDGTLAEAIWPVRGIGPPIPEALIFVQGLRDEGKKIVIHTSRPWADYENIERWLDDHNIPWDQIQCGKPMMAAYYDDRAVRPAWTEGLSDGD